MAVPFWRGWSELLQEPFVVLEDQPQVADLEVAHGEAFQTHAEGEAGILVRINAAVAQHLGVHHAGAQHFDPALALAGGAALAAALVALHVHLAARLGEREVVRAEARDRALAVELFDLCHRRFDGALLVGVGRGGRRLSHFLCCHWFILLFLLLYLKIFCQISLQSRP